MDELAVKHLQTVVSASEYREIDDFMRDNGITNLKEWMRQLVLKEVRKGNDTISLPLHK